MTKLSTNSCFIKQRFECYTTPIVIIQKGNKVNSVLLVEKNVYIRHIEKILDNATKFEKTKIKKGILNFSINHERRINDYFKSLEKSGSLTLISIRESKQPEVDQEFYMGFVRCIKLSLMFVCHLNLYFR